MTEIKQEPVDDLADLGDFIDSVLEDNVGQLPAEEMDTVKDIKPEVKYDEKDHKRCLVCDNIAGRHSYYGGQVCNSCRAFFRRAVVGKAYPDFKCRQASNCTINSKSRKSCQSCRYQKCLEAGMQPRWIMSEAEVKVRRERKKSVIVQRARNSSQSEQQKMEKNLKKTDDEKMDHVKMLLRPQGTSRLDEPYTMDELNMVQELSKDTMEYYFTKVAKFLAKHRDIHSEMFGSRQRVLSFGTHRMLDKFAHGLCVGLYMNLHKVSDHASAGTSCLKCLPVEDARTLSVGNYGLILSMAHAIYARRPDAVASRRDFLSLVLRDADRDGDFKFLAGELERSIAADSASADAPLDYWDLFPRGWVPSADAARRHREVTDKLSGWFPRAAGSEAAPRDEVCFTLMVYVLLFSSEFLTLQSRKKVEEVQLGFMRMLYRYLRFRFPQVALKKFVEGMIMVSYAREAQEIRRKRVNVA